MAKITVLTATFRDWDFLLKQRDALEDQTFQDFEWVIVDDLLATGQRAFKVQAGFLVTHVPPSHYSVYMAEANAKNTGLLFADGELVYLMNDYVLPSPKVLERHWELYQTYGPKVMISGPLIGETARDRRPEFMVGDGVGKVSYDHLNSNQFTEFWAGRNDSAPLAALLGVNGFEETIDGGKGGIDLEIALRMAHWGCEHLVDQREWAAEVLHRYYQTSKEGYDGHYWVALYQKVKQERRIVSMNSWNIAHEREITRVSH